MRNDVIIIKEIKVDSKLIAQGWGVSEEKVIATHRDARSSSRYVENIFRELFNFNPLPENTCQKDSDASVFCGSDILNVSIKCLTRRGVKLQPSRYQGCCRKCEKKDLRNSLSDNEWFGICDIRKWPIMMFIKFDSKLAIEWFDNGNLTTSGLHPKKFYRLLNSSFRVVNFECYLKNPISNIYVISKEIYNKPQEFCHESLFKEINSPINNSRLFS